MSEFIPLTIDDLKVGDLIATTYNSHYCVHQLNYIPSNLDQSFDVVKFTRVISDESPTPFEFGVSSINEWLKLYGFKKFKIDNAKELVI